MGTNFKQLSKGEWSGDSTSDNINAGSLQRIADATELMAKNYVSLQRDRDYYERRYNEEKKSGQRMAWRIRALKAVITRMNNKSLNS